MQEKKTEGKSEERIMKGILLRPANIEFVQKLAEREHRSFSNAMDRVIERYRESIEELAGR